MGASRGVKEPAKVFDDAVDVIRKLHERWQKRLTFNNLALAKR